MTNIAKEQIDNPYYFWLGEDGEMPEKKKWVDCPCCGEQPRVVKNSESCDGWMIECDNQDCLLGSSDCCVAGYVWNNGGWGDME